MVETLGFFYFISPMKKIIFFFIVWLVFLAFPSSIRAIPIADSSAMLKNKVNEEKVDFRTLALEKFLEIYNSPLANYASVFVEIADKYQVDWRLVPAITGVESTFGRRIPSGSFNAYGWGNGKITFASWEESIEVVTKTLKEKYIDRGLDTPHEIARVYAPPSLTWGNKVSYFMKKIQETKEKLQFPFLSI